MIRDGEGTPYALVDVALPGGDVWPFIIKKYRQNRLSIARRAVNGDELQPSLWFDANWDPGKRFVYALTGLSWEHDDASAPMRAALGASFPDAVAAWTDAVRSLAGDDSS